MSNNLPESPLPSATADTDPAAIAIVEAVSAVDGVAIAEPIDVHSSGLPGSFVRNEIRLHWMFIAMPAAVLVLSFLMRSDGPTDVYLPGFEFAMPATCTSQQLTGVDCPGCGLTRSFIAISHGQWGRAWSFNAAGFVVYAFCAIQIPWHGIQIVRLRRGRLPITTAWVYWVPMIMVVALVTHWIVKLV